MNKKTLVNLGRTINLFNVSLFRNPRTYIIGMVLPIFISLLLEFLWARYSSLELTPPEMVSFMYVPVILAAFYIGIFSNEIRQNLFRKKINIKINNQSILKYSIVILALELALINLVITTILFYAIAQADTLGFKKEMFENLMAFVWVYYVFFGIMLGIISSLVFLLLESLFSKRAYAILSMSVALFFMLFFSDVIIPSRVISNINAMNVIGYFNPVKYVTWSMNLLSSYQFEDSLGKLQIYLAKGGSFEPFNMLWQSTVPAMILLVLFIVAYWYKKEDK